MTAFSKINFHFFTISLLSPVKMIKKTDLLKNLDVYSVDSFDITEVWRTGKKIKQKEVNQLKDLDNTFALFSYDSKKGYLEKTFGSVKEYTFYHKRDSEKKVYIYIINN